MTTVEKVFYDYIQRNSDEFCEFLFMLGKSDIVDLANECSVRNDIRCLLEEMELSDEQMLAIISIDDPFGKIYERWLEVDHSRQMEEIKECIMEITEEVIGMNHNHTKREEPEMCYAVLPSSKEIIIVRRYEKGYYKTDITTTSKYESIDIVNEYNSILGVTKQEQAAMLAGSMFGWDCPAADASNYDMNGKPIMKEACDE